MTGSTFLHNLTLVITLIFFVLRFQKYIRIRRPKLFAFVGPLAFGLFSVVIMMNPLMVDGGSIFDLRSVPLLIFSFLHGWRMGLVAAVFPAVYRMFLGGPHVAEVIVITMLMPAFIGSLFRNKHAEQPLLQKLDLIKVVLMALQFYIFNYVTGFIVLDMPAADWNEIALLQFVFGTSALLAMSLMINDDSNAQVNQDNVKRMVIMDIKTKAYNYRYALEVSKRWRDTGESFRVILADIDFFKHYNDTNGHLEGDQVLEEFAVILKESVRSDDIVVRYGGEEFFVMVKGLPENQVERMAERIRLKVEAHPFRGADTQPSGKLTVSIGVSPEGEDLEGLIKLADYELYNAKRGGKNRIFICDQAHSPPLFR